jgi:hypothetical protein
MFSSETAETTDFKHCRVCGAVQMDHDRFCRRCGASQNRHIEPVNCNAGSIAGAVVGRLGKPGTETEPLPGSGTLRRSYSGPLVSIVTQQLSEQTSSLRANRRAMLLISILIAAPLWLMIVLLSPLDAYNAAKDIAKQV